MSIIVILAASSLIMVEAASSEITKPSIPEFTVKFIDASYNVPTTSSIDPYTGHNVTHEGYHVENRTIELIIKNQPFDSYIANGQNISFYLNVREKGHHEENWTTIYTVDNHYTTQSNTNYTILTYLLDQNVPPFWNNIPSGGQVDFQVEALIGYVGRTVGFASWYFNGEESDWSNIQTISIPDKAVSPTASPNPTATPQQSDTQSGVLFGLSWEQTAVAVLAIAVALLAVTLILSRRKRSV